MSTRLSRGGRLIDRSAAQDFTFNGKRFKGYAGDTLAAALLANDQMMAQMSKKGGFIAALDQSGGSSPGALRLYGIPDSAYSGDAETRSRRRVNTP